MMILLKHHNDWVLRVEMGKEKMEFPPGICVTELRPDIVLYSREGKKVIVIELTCPIEDNIPDAQVRKTIKYLPLINEIKENGWTPTFFTIEVGARGLVSNSLPFCLKRLGVRRLMIKRLCKAASLAAVSCSYTIWVCREQPSWDDNREFRDMMSSGNMFRDQ